MLSKLFKSRSHIPQKTGMHIIFNHLLAAILPLTALSIIMVLDPQAKMNSLLIFFPVVILSAWIGGLSAGIVTTFISLILLNYHVLNLAAVSASPDIFYFFQSLLFASEGVLISFIVDIVKYRERIRKYKQREKELNKTIEKLEEKNASYEKEIKTRNEFLSIASHELKTPLTSMLLQTQTALHNIKNVSVAKFSFDNLLKMLHSVENQTQRLSKMINDLLSVSIITSGNLELEYEEVNLNKLVKNVIDDFGARLEKERIKIIFNSPSEITGQFDKIRIEQAISNFISNAIKYGSGKPIDIKLMKGGKNAILTITDHGIGISRDKQKSIFELFSRGVPSDQYKGLGIGLFITQKIVNAHGGYIEVKSRPGKGSEFKVVLPILNIKNRKIIPPKI